MDESKAQQHEAENTTTMTTLSTSTFEWDAVAILQSIAIFVLAALLEILGGWLIWAAIKGIRIPTDQPFHNDNITSTNTTNNDNDEFESTPTSQYTTLKKPWYYALLGSVALILYGFVPCLQPSASSDGFARIYAAYGGFFIVLSYLLGWALEGSSAKPDAGDLVGGGISLVGAAVILFWPR